MKALFFAAALSVAAGGASAQAVAPQPVAPQAAPEIAFDAVDFLKPPADMNLGEIAGVAVNGRGHVFVFQRGNTNGPAFAAAAAQLLEFGPDGRLIREIGKGLYAWSFAHAVKIDPEGAIWAADKGSDMVIKFTPEGRVAMVIGRKPEATNDDAKPLGHPRPPLPAVDGMFREVTDMTWDHQGNTYISDGYVNSRVAKIAKDGQWLTSWGSKGTAPGQFQTLHSIDSDASDRIYVADRGNRRIQVFDTAGKLLKIITVDVAYPADAPTAIGPRPNSGVPSPYAGAPPGTFEAGSPWAICITPPNAAKTQYLYVSDAYPGRVYKLTLDGKVLGWLGGSGKQLKQFGWIHEMACPSENEIYVGEILNWRLQKLSLHPTREQH